MKKIIPLALLVGSLPFIGYSANQGRDQSAKPVHRVERSIQALNRPQLPPYLTQVPTPQPEIKPVITGNWNTVLDYFTQFARESPKEDTFFYNTKQGVVYDIGFKETQTSGEFSIDDCIRIVEKSGPGVFDHVHNHRIPLLKPGEKAQPLETMYRAVPSFVDVGSYIDLQNEINKVTTNSQQPIEMRYMVINPFGRTEMTLHPGQLYR